MGRSSGRVQETHMTSSLLPAQHHSSHTQAKACTASHPPKHIAKSPRPILSPFALFPSTFFPFSAATGCAVPAVVVVVLVVPDSNKETPRCKKLLTGASMGKYSPGVTKMNLDGLVRCPARASLWCRLVLIARSERGSFFRLLAPVFKIAACQTGQVHDGETGAP